MPSTLAILALYDGAFWAKIVTEFGVAVGPYFVALWAALCVWTDRDARARSLDDRMRNYAVALVALFNVPGFLLYLALRPPELTAERYNRELEAAAFLYEIEHEKGCPACGMAVEQAYVVCPHCRARLQERCARCDRPLRAGWTLCPYCADERAAPVAVPAAAGACTGRSPDRRLASQAGTVSGAHGPRPVAV